MIQQLELQRPVSDSAAPDFNIPVLTSLVITVMGLLLTGVSVWDSEKIVLEVTVFLFIVPWMIESFQFKCIGSLFVLLGVFSTLVSILFTATPSCSKIEMFEKTTNKNRPSFDDIKTISK